MDAATLDRRVEGRGLHERVVALAQQLEHKVNTTLDRKLTEKADTTTLDRNLTEKVDTTILTSSSSRR